MTSVYFNHWTKGIASWQCFVSFLFLFLYLDSSSLGPKWNGPLGIPLGSWGLQCLSRYNDSWQASRLRPTHWCCPDHRCMNDLNPPRRPEFLHASTSGDEETSNSTPTKSPSPRTSFRCGFPTSLSSSNSFKCWPFLDTLARNSGFWILSNIPQGQHGRRADHKQTFLHGDQSLWNVNGIHASVVPPLWIVWMRASVGKKFPHSISLDSIDSSFLRKYEGFFFFFF